MDNKKYIERIKNLREDHDYTQEYVSNYLGTSQTMYAVSSDYILGPSNKL